MTLSLVIPAFNEAERLPPTLTTIAEYFRTSASAQADLTLQEVIIVDDGSTDATSAVAASWADRLPIKVITCPVNRGKGAVVRDGMLAAQGDLCLLYDADGATPIDEVSRLLSAMEKEHASIAIGSRVDPSKDVLMKFHRRIIGRTYHAICAGLHPGIRDAACGCKLFKRDIAHALFARQRINRFAFDIEILALAIGQGERVAEVPVSWQAIEKSRVNIWRDGPQMFWCVLVLYVRRLFGQL